MITQPAFKLKPLMSPNTFKRHSTTLNSQFHLQLTLDYEHKRGNLGNTKRAPYSKLMPSGAGAASQNAVGHHNFLAGFWRHTLGIGTNLVGVIFSDPIILHDGGLEHLSRKKKQVRQSGAGSRAVPSIVIRMDPQPRVVSFALLAHRAGSACACPPATFQCIPCLSDTEIWDASPIFGS